MLKRSKDRIGVDEKTAIKIPRRSLQEIKVGDRKRIYSGVLLVLAQNYYEIRIKSSLACSHFLSSNSCFFISNWPNETTNATLTDFVVFLNDLLHNNYIVIV